MVRRTLNSELQIDPSTWLTTLHKPPFWPFDRRGRPSVMIGIILTRIMAVKWFKVVILTKSPIWTSEANVGSSSWTINPNFLKDTSSRLRVLEKTLKLQTYTFTWTFEFKCKLSPEPLNFNANLHLHPEVWFSCWESNFQFRRPGQHFTLKLSARVKVELEMQTFVSVFVFQPELQLEPSEKFKSHVQDKDPTLEVERSS